MLHNFIQAAFINFFSFLFLLSVQIQPETLGRITDIGATHYSHISTAVSHLTSTCYIWGQCHGQSGKIFLKDLLTFLFSLSYIEIKL